MIIKIGYYNLGVLTEVSFDTATAILHGNTMVCTTRYGEDSWVAVVRIEEDRTLSILDFEEIGTSAGCNKHIYEFVNYFSGVL